MTNETTASQPKSIGDDAQFRELILVWKFADSQEKSDIACRKVIEHLDSRAPAAQASATIQEPVMVAEPVGDGLPPEVQKLFDQLRPEIDYWCAHRRESNLAALDAIEFRFKVSQARTVRLESTALAAPMVADPAGVALQDLLTAEFECYRPTYPHGLLVWARNALLDTSPHRAATVKAVPSEALELAGMVVKATFGEHKILVPRVDLSGKEIGTLVYFAAPLADKTGGAE